MTAEGGPPTADDLPAGWVPTTLGEACEVNPRMSWPESFTKETPVSFVPMAAVDDVTGAIVAAESRPIDEVWRGYKRFAEGDVIFARITPCMENGKAAIATGLLNGIGLGSTEFHVLRPTEAVSAEWIYHFVRQQSFRNEAAREMTGTAGQLRVPKSFMEEAPIPLPPEAEQQRIVAKIEALFAQSRRGREALDAVPDLLAQFRQAVLAAAFRGDLTERDPTDEPASVLLERTRAERHRRWEGDLRAKGKDPSRRKYKEPAPPDTSDLPELPGGWVWTKLGRLFTVKIGGTPARKMPEYWDGDIPWVSSGEVAFCRINATHEYITAAGLAKSSAKLNPPGTVLLAMIGEGKTRGQSAILDVAAANNQNVAAILCSETPVLPEWVFWWLRARYQETRGGGSGGAQPALNASRVKELTIPLAPLAEQRHTVARIEVLFAQVDILEAQVAAVRRWLEQVDQAILARAFRGELVPQDLDDEPASVLLERIREEREAQAANKQTRKSRSNTKKVQQPKLF